jgi:hypothetical protein
MHLASSMVEHPSVEAVPLQRASSYCYYSSAIQLECPVHKSAPCLELEVVEEDGENLTMNCWALEHNMLLSVHYKYKSSVG